MTSDVAISETGIGRGSRSRATARVTMSRSVSTPDRRPSITTPTVPISRLSINRAHTRTSVEASTTTGSGVMSEATVTAMARGPPLPVIYDTPVALCERSRRYERRLQRIAVGQHRHR